MPSLERILATIEAIYDASADEARWPRALESLADLLGGSGTVIAFQDDAGRFPVYHFIRSSPELNKAYAEHYRRVDPILAFVSRAPPLKAVSDRMVMPKAELRRLEIYNEFGLPNDMPSVIQAVALRTPRCAGRVFAGRSARAGDVEQEHVRTLDLLLPHLGRAMRLNLRLGAAHAHADGATETLDRLALGVVLVDQRARVILANRAAEAILESDGIGADASGLRAATPSQTAALRQLVARAADRSRVAGRGGALRLERPSMRRPLSVLVAPIGMKGGAWLPEPRPAAIVLVSDPEQEGHQPAPHLRALYDLTPAEAAVAEGIAQGQGVREAAEALGVAPSTVRTHLQHVFEKTGTNRQAELARLVERLRVVGGD